MREEKGWEVGGIVLVEGKRGINGGRSRSMSAGGLLVKGRSKMETAGRSSRPKSHGLHFCRCGFGRRWGSVQNFRSAPGPRWTFGLLLTWVGRRKGWQRGPEVKKAGQEGRCQKPKGGSRRDLRQWPRPGGEERKTGCLVEARPRRRTAARAGARPLGDGLGESLAADTWTDGPERGFGGIKGGGGANIMRGLDMQRSQFRGESNAGARRPEQHVGRSSFLRPSLFQHFNTAAN